MLKQPKTERGYLFDTMLTFESAANWCRFIADSLEWNDQDPAYWRGYQSHYQGLVDQGLVGVVAHKLLEEKVSLMSRSS